MSLSLIRPRIDILDFTCFKYDILTPDSYVESAKEIYDAGEEADEYPPYMVIYDTVYGICKEQCGIVDNGVDLLVLSSTFGALPRLTKLGLTFCEAAEGETSTLSFIALGMTIAEASHEHHLRVVSSALRFARNMGVFIHTISLSGFDLPYRPWGETPDLSTLLESLTEVLEFPRVLCLTRSNFPLELLCHRVLNLH